MPIGKWLEALTGLLQSCIMNELATMVNLNDIPSYKKSLKGMLGGMTPE